MIIIVKWWQLVKQIFFPFYENHCEICHFQIGKIFNCTKSHKPLVKMLKIESNTCYIKILPWKKKEWKRGKPFTRQKVSIDRPEWERKSTIKMLCNIEFHPTYITITVYTIHENSSLSHLSGTLLCLYLPYSLSRFIQSVHSDTLTSRHF